MAANPDVPSFHREGLAFVPKPSEINGEDQKNECLHAQAMMHGIARLTQGAEQIAAQKNDAKQQNTLVKPARHPPLEAGREVRDRVTEGGQFWCWR